MRELAAKRAGVRFGVTYQLALFILLAFLVVFFGVKIGRAHV